MTELRLIKTTASALEEIADLSRLKFQVEALYTNYWKAGRWHSDEERETIDRILADIRSGIELQLDRKKRDYSEAPQSITKS